MLNPNLLVAKLEFAYLTLKMTSKQNVYFIPIIIPIELTMIESAVLDGNMYLGHESNPRKTTIHIRLNFAIT